MQSDQFETVLSKFTHSPEFRHLNIGKVRQLRQVSQFERHFSVQRIYSVDGERGSRRIYVKLYKNAYQRSLPKFEEAILHDYETNLFWYNKLAHLNGYSTIRPLFVSIPHRTIITEEAKGRNLGELVQQELRFRPNRKTLQTLEDYMTRTGRLLRVIQDFEVEQQPYRLTELVEDIDQRLRDFIQNPASRFSADLRRQILDFYDAHMAEAEQKPLRICYLHRDFMMGNLLVNGKEIIVHDFSRVFIGPGLLDLTRFYHHLELLKYKPIYADKAVTRLQQAFLRGYDESISPDDILFKFFLLRHYVTHYKGLINETGVPLKSRLYNRRVMARHLQNIRRIIGKGD